MGRRKPKIALAPLIGLGAGLAMWLSYVKKGYDAYGWNGAKCNALSSLTGFTYNGETGAYEGWKSEEMAKGLVPIVAFSLAGWGAHKLANKMGVNRSIPYVSI